MHVGIAKHEPSVTRASLLATLTSNLSVDVTGSCKIGITDESTKLWVLPVSIKIMTQCPLILPFNLMVPEVGVPTNAYSVISATASDKESEICGSGVALMVLWIGKIFYLTCRFGIRV